MAYTVFPLAGENAKPHNLTIKSSDALALNIWYRDRFWQFVCALEVFEDPNLDMNAMLESCKRRADEKLKNPEVKG